MPTIMWASGAWPSHRGTAWRRTPVRSGMKGASSTGLRPPLPVTTSTQRQPCARLARMKLDSVAWARSAVIPCRSSRASGGRRPRFRRSAVRRSRPAAGSKVSSAGGWKTAVVCGRARPVGRSTVRGGRAGAGASDGGAPRPCAGSAGGGGAPAAPIAAGEAWPGRSPGAGSRPSSGVASRIAARHRARSASLRPGARRRREAMPGPRGRAQPPVAVRTQFGSFDPILRVKVHRSVWRRISLGSPSTT